MSPWIRAAGGLLLSAAVTAGTAGSCSPATSGPPVLPVVSGTPAAVTNSRRRRARARQLNRRRRPLP